jgi:ribonuclease BN (tRNA processing enzyme)
MLLTFFGTKGFVAAESPSHRGHSAWTLEVGGFRLLCDYGRNRKGMLSTISPDAVFLSHAHPDHAGGLEERTELPVYASAATHEITNGLPMARRIVLEPGARVAVGPLALTAFPVVHSVRCPCIAARIETPEGVVVYSGDIVAFEDPVAALSGAALYVGDGSTLEGALVRRHSSGVLIGHTTVRAQLRWLGKHGVPRAVFSHFGEGPIRMGDEALAQALRELAGKKAPGCEVTAAGDGLSLTL